MQTNDLQLKKALRSVLLVLLLNTVGMTKANGQGNAPIGAINSIFSVSENTQVYFSQGNLQYQASTNTWRFAEKQYDYIGSANTNISSTYSGWIDLFGWGTSGYNHGAVCYQPWSTSENNSDYYAYGSSYNNLNNQTGQADWGYNAISNGGNQTNQWRTLTTAEWVFLFNTRNTTSGIRFAMAKVNNVNGVILLPDNWSSTYYALNNTNNTSASFSSNSISLSSWSNLEVNGAVFLPAAGFRDGSYVYGVGSNGGYQTATHYNSNGVYDLYFSNSNLLLEGTCPRSNAQSVRLVHTVPTYSIDASVIPSNGGNVTGMGNYAEGQLCTLIAAPNEGYVFAYWTENGQLISADSTYSFIVTENRALVANFVVFEIAPIGAIKGLFSVSANQQVYFSQGNLQYKASTHTWRFAENQWDYVGTQNPASGYGNAGGTVNGSDNTGISSSYSGWIDLFGWATSGFNHGAVCYQPWSTSTNEDYYRAYGKWYYDLDDQTGQADWGYNYISNGGNKIKLWHTLSDYGWNYVFNNRATISGIRYAKAVVNGVNGVILLPDNWDASYYTLNNTNQGSANFTSNIITTEQWIILELYGAVFLPAAGYRFGNSVRNVGTIGYYWSATSEDDEEACDMSFSNTYISATGSEYRDFGHCVRLVRNAMHTIGATSNPVLGGIVTGAGLYQYGSTAILSATVNEGYVFTNWTENDNVISTDATYSFTVTGDRHLVANFQLQNYTITASANPTEGGTVSIGGNSYNYDFEDGTLQGWTVVDADGDGNNWYIRSEFDSSDGYNLYGHSGSYFVVSFSYYEDEINPNNYLISPEVSDANLIHYFVAGNYSDRDHYGLYASTTGNQISDFSLVFEETIPAASVKMTSWYERTIELPEGTKYVAFRHFNSYDRYYVLLDDISISSDGWQTCTLTATPNEGYTFINWTENDTMVSTEPTYSFTVTDNRTLVANFSLIGFHFTTLGNWSQASNWQGNALPGANETVFIDAPCQLDQNATVADLTITANQSLTMQAGKTLTVTGTLTNSVVSALVIEDSAQLIHNNIGVQATVKKTISGYGTSSDKWYFITNPITDSIIPSTDNGLLSGNYDFYYCYPTSADRLEWRNYKSSAFALHNGEGYLYANEIGTELSFGGTLAPSNSNVMKTVYYEENNNSPGNGWTLLGNPFACNCYLVDANGNPLTIYKMNATGTGLEEVLSGPIAPFEGFFYYTTETRNVYFSRTAPAGLVP